MTTQVSLETLEITHRPNIKTQETLREKIRIPQTFLICQDQTLCSQKRKIQARCAKLVVVVAEMHSDRVCFGSTNLQRQNQVPAVLFV